jgi:hypothetical protein
MAHSRKPSPGDTGDAEAGQTEAALAAYDEVARRYGMRPEAAFQ